MLNLKSTSNNTYNGKAIALNIVSSSMSIYKEGLILTVDSTSGERILMLNTVEYMYNQLTYNFSGKFTKKFIAYLLQDESKLRELHNLAVYAYCDTNNKTDDKKYFIRRIENMMFDYAYNLLYEK